MRDIHRVQRDLDPLPCPHTDDPWAVRELPRLDDDLNCVPAAARAGNARPTNQHRRKGDGYEVASSSPKSKGS